MPAACTRAAASFLYLCLFSAPISAIASDSYETGTAALLNGDYATAWRILAPLAEAGDARAQNDVGVMFGRGLGVAHRSTIGEGPMRFRQLMAACLTVTCGMALGGVGALEGQSDSVCTASPACAEVTDFTATVSGFRESVSGIYRFVAATVRFKNKTDRELRLGFVTGSAVVIDDRGNRYQIVRQTGVRGIGEVSNTTFDPKFTLRPGEESDGRFEFYWQPARGVIYGTSYEIDMAVREIETVADGQYRLGREHALHFSGFGEGAAALAQPATISASDPCAGQPRCHFATAFAAEVTRVTQSVSGQLNYQVIAVTVKFTNMTSEPLILGFTDGSSVAVDDVGNRYLWNRAGTTDTGVSGIGIVGGGSADPSFVLEPGGSGSATLKVWFQAGQKQVGTRYTFDFTVERLEILPSRQIMSRREYAVGFRDLTAGSWSGSSVLEELVDAMLRSAGVSEP